MVPTPGLACKRMGSFCFSLLEQPRKPKTETGEKARPNQPVVVPANATEVRLRNGDVSAPVDPMWSRTTAPIAQAAEF